MRNEIAEWMLAQAATPEQATTILGDLLEAQPGPVAFWFAVLRATASIAAHQPRRIFASLFWLAYELGIYADLSWLYAHVPYSSHQLLLRLAALVPICFIGWLLHWRRVQPSELALFLGSGMFWIWISLHAGLSTWQMILSLCLIPAFWARRWWLLQAMAAREKNRPVAG